MLAITQVACYLRKFLCIGTKLEEKLRRGVRGKNALDEACKEHDISYSNCEDSKSRREADKILIKRAFNRIYARNSKLDERAAALLVSGLMTAKVGLTKIGFGLNSSSKPKKGNSHTRRADVRKQIAFKKLLQSAKKSIKKSRSKSLSVDKTVKAAIRTVNKLSNGRKIKVPRVLELPKFYGGNINSILPTLSALASVGSIASSTVNIVKTIQDIKNASKQIKKENKHSSDTHREIETKIGGGLSLIYKADKNAKRSAFFLKPYQEQRR